MSAFLPPLVVHVRVRGEGTRGFRIWLPVVLFWPLLLVVFVLALIGTAVADLVQASMGATYHRYTAFLLSALRLLPETRGTRVYVAGDDNLLDIEIY